MVAGPDTEVVSRCGVDMQLRCDAGMLQRQICYDAVLGRADDVCAAMREKNWRRAARNRQAGSKFILVLRLQIARIDNDREVRPAARPVDSIDGRIRSLLEARRRREG